MGLANDGDVIGEYYKLSKGEFNIYYTEDSFYTSSPLPTGWIDIFRNMDKNERPMSANYNIKFNKNYMPIMPERMISPKNTKKTLEQLLQEKTIAKLKPVISSQQTEKRKKPPQSAKMQQYSTMTKIYSNSKNDSLQTTRLPKPSELMKTVTTDLQEEIKIEEEYVPVKPILQPKEKMQKYKDGFSSDSTTNEERPVEIIKQIRKKPKRKIIKKEDRYMKTLMFI